MASALLGPFVHLLAFFRGARDRHDDLTRAALSALGKALTETRLYLRDQDRTGARDETKEDQIVRLWQEAANELWGLDTQLANACHDKADYWLNPEGWNHERIRAKGIEIDRIYETYGDLLNVPDARIDREPR